MRDEVFLINKRHWTHCAATSRATGKAFHFMTGLICSSRGVPQACSRLLISSPKSDKETLICDKGLKPSIFVTRAFQSRATRLCYGVPFFRVPVKLALGDLGYTNPAERDTEHSFLVCFPPNTQAQRQGKQTKPDKCLCWPSLQCS